VTQRTAQLSRQTAERTKNSAAVAKTKISKFDQQVNFTGAVTSVAIGKAAADLVCRKNMKGCAGSLSVAGAAVAAKNILKEDGGRSRH
jgi:hypothetical protein